MDIHYKLVREIDRLPPGRKDIHVAQDEAIRLADWMASACWPSLGHREAMEKLEAGKFYLLGKQVKVQ